MPQYALLLAYDGGDFAGFWRQPGRRTVGAELDAACQRIGEASAVAEPASRTDSGVHARGQVASLTTSRTWDAADLSSALDHHLPPDLACRGVAEVADDWHAAGSALAKTYRYRLEVGNQRSPFLARTSWRVSPQPDIACLQRLGQTLQGDQDGRAFARRGDHRSDHRFRVQACEWTVASPECACTITANRFSLNLVRSLVGAMVAVAAHRQPESDWLRALSGTDGLPLTRQVAPARGLCLEQVHYAQELSWSLTEGGD